MSLTALRYLHSVRRYKEVTLAAPPMCFFSEAKKIVWTAKATFFISKIERESMKLHLAFSQATGFRWGKGQDRSLKIEVKNLKK